MLRKLLRLAHVLIRIFPHQPPLIGKVLVRTMLMGLALIGAGMLSSCAFGATNPIAEPLHAQAVESPAATANPDEPSEPNVLETPTVGNFPEAQASQSAAGGEWLYKGELEPEDEITVVTEVGGRVLAVEVEEGERVSAWQVILRVDGALLEAQRADALAGLQVAQAQVDLLQTEANESDIEAARADVAAAEAAYQRALNGPSEEELTAAQTKLYEAEAALRRAQAAYDQVSWNPMIAALPESRQLQQATLALEAAQAEYDQVVAGASEEVIARAYAQLASARAKLQRLEDGPAEAELQAAEAQVRQAETELYLAQLQLEKATVRSPIDGIVAELNLVAGATALPGSPALRLFSPTVQIAIAVEEKRMAQLRLGQPVRIMVNAYPGETFEGAVTAIAPELDPSTATVRVTVQPTGDATRLTPGMAATVELLHE